MADTEFYLLALLCKNRNEHRNNLCGFYGIIKCYWRRKKILSKMFLCGLFYSSALTDGMQRVHLHSSKIVNLYVI